MRYQDDYEELIAYLEGSLDEVAAARLEKRLAESAVLRAECEWLRQVIADADALRTGSYQIDVVGSVMEKINEEPVGVDFSLLADCLEGGRTCNDSTDIMSHSNWDNESRAAGKWLRGFMMACQELQEEHARRTPRIDCVDSVLSVIVAGESSSARKDFKRRKVSVRRIVLGGWLAAAAATFVLAGSLFVALREKPSASTAVSQSSVTDISQKRTADPKGDFPKISGNRFSVLQEKVGRPWQKVASDEKIVFEAVPAPVLKGLTPDTLVSTWRRIGTDASAWTQIRQWATLSTEQAHDIFAAKQHIPEAVVGASAALLPEEREIALLTAIGHMPGDPAVRFALAKDYYGKPQETTAATETLNSLQSLDKENALPLYLEARLRLDSGDVSGALTLLDRAREMERASAYALRTAQFREQALVASGMSEEIARLLTAMTAGMDEYDFLCQLGHDLLQYGRYLADNGDTSSAEAIYQSVRRLGQQLNNGADFLPEQMAALDVERQAVVMMQDLYTALGSEEGVEALANQALDLIGRIEGIEGFARGVEEFLAATTDVNTWLQWADALLGNGIRPLLDMFRQGRFDVGTFIRGFSAPKSLLTALNHLQGL
ncbi:MAG TPA: hypothetical protein PKY35_07110 [Candidatus Hydrogenedentes bacterium]|nr:hypothetical protein [Candidatus Hydrogenedentota bacterium]HOL76784.1 hypothetical protein [Candidatus Hydrogenedentota bacterium]HPO85739.1 hypothetical protein [Candidatus Hydrogenedentota bacterium]